MIFKSTLLLESGYHLFDVPVEIGQKLSESGTHRMRLTINEGPTFSLALHHRKEGTYYLMLGKGRIRKAGVKPGEICRLELVPDTSKYGMEMPPIFKEVMDTDPEAFEQFETLSPGTQRSLMHMVGSAKRTDTQIDRAVKIAEKLRMGFSKTREFM